MFALFFTPSSQIPDTPKMRARLRTQPAFTSTRQHHRAESVFGAVVLYMDRASDLVEMLIF